MRLVFMLVVLLAVTALWALLMRGRKL